MWMCKTLWPAAFVDVYAELVHAIAENACFCVRNANAVFGCNDSNVKPIVANEPRKALEKMYIPL